MSASSPLNLESDHCLRRSAGTAKNQRQQRDGIDLMEPTLVAEPVKKPAALGKTVHTRRNFLRLAACSAAGLAVYSGEIARHEIEVVHQTIKLAGLPEAFGGFRIVQISDVHFREYTEAA